MGRTALVYLVPAIVTAVAWLRLERERESRDLVWILLLALLPALAPRLRLRLAAAVPAALLAAWIALGARPDDEGAIWRGVKDGFLEFYDVQVPFAAGTHPEMHGVLMLGIFLFCLAIALALAARRSFLAVLALVAGAGWPATLLEGGRDLALGGAILAAALWMLAGLRARTPRALVPAAIAGGVLVLAAVAAASNGGVAKGGLLGWQGWDLYDLPVKPVGVDYVWDAQYDGINFPERKTVVLRIKAPRLALYWRATTLDAFAQDRWFENVHPLSSRPFDGPLPADPLVPKQPPERWVRQEVEIGALRDDHLVAATSPVQLRARGVGPVYLLSGGVARTAKGLTRGESYIVWSAVGRPSPKQLAAVPPSYPAAVQPDLDVNPSTRMLPFGAAGRDEQLRAIFTEARTDDLHPYRPLVEAAQRVTRGARTPYEAVVELESWLRSSGGFRYDEHPRRAVTGVPPLVDFVTASKAGYCQHYAGAMALMLRYLGIPARVAVGFTSGTYKDGVWTVTDHEAHAWVEVWFRGYGWLSFDPTPGRATLSGTYTTASESADTAREAISAATGGRIDPRAIGANFNVAGRGGGAGGRSGGLGFARLLLLLVAAVGVCIGLAKLGRRRLRYLTRDPRRRATAARRELAEFLRDQGLPVASGATAGELRRVLADELGLDGRRFADAVGRARYGPPAGAPDSALRARRELRGLLRVLRARLSTLERLRGWVALRSLRGA